MRRARAKTAGPAAEAEVDGAIMVVEKEAAVMAAGAADMVEAAGAVAVVDIKGEAAGIKAAAAGDISGDNRIHEQTKLTATAAARAERRTSNVER
jgi:hypothetical protein